MLVNDNSYLVAVAQAADDEAARVLSADETLREADEWLDAGLITPDEHEDLVSEAQFFAQTAPQDFRGEFNDALSQVSL